jgi:hypothetical protein
MFSLEVAMSVTRWLLALVLMLLLLGAVYTAGGGKDGKADPLRIQFFEGYESRTKLPIKGVKAALAAKKDPDLSDLDEIRQATTKTFAQLDKSGLLDPRLAAYENQWTKLKDLKAAPAEFGERAVTFVEAFIACGTAAHKGTKATVTVGASKGDGALIKYVKAADAAAGVPSNQFGISLVTKEIERAAYIFQAFRNGKETGRTDRVDCTDSKQPVVVTVVEK